MKKIYNLSIIFILLFLGCTENSKDRYESEFADEKVKLVTVEFSIYEGIIPCADCEGIKMSLKIANDFQSYELTELYLGKNENEIVSKGSLNTERGFEDDPDATVYILNYDQPKINQRYFVRLTKHQNQIFMLDRNKKIIKSELNYSLVKK